MNPAKPINSAQSSAQHPQLKVVPPKLIPVPKDELTDSQVDSTPSGKASPVLEPERSERKLEGTENVTFLNPQSQTSKGKGLMVGAIAFGLVAVGLVPFDQKVEGLAVIDSAPLERQTIPLHQGYVIEQLGVLHNKEVKAGELVAKVYDEQLLQQLSEVEQKLAQANSEYKLAQQTYSVYLQKQEQAHLSATLAARRTLERKQDIDRINQGLIPEPLLELRQSQATREIELEGIKNQLNQINREIARYEDLVKQGALSKATMDKLERERLAFENQLNTKKSEIDQSKAKIKAETRRLVDEFSGRRDEVQEKEGAVVAQAQEVQVAVAEVNKWKNQIVQLENQQNRLHQKQKILTYKADIGGLVVAPEIDKWRGQKLPESKEIQIINTTNLPALVKVKEYDAAPIKAGMFVTYIPEGQQRKYTAKVQETELPVVDPTTQNRVVPVRIVFDDPNARFVLGTSGRATIQVKRIRVYEFIGREVYRVFNPLINKLR